jgi:hypothetical protein
MAKMSILALGLVAGLVACGGDSFSGKVSGYSFSPKEAIFVVGSNDQGSLILMSDQIGLCADLKSNQAQSLPNATTLGLVLFSSTDQGPQMVTTGTYIATDDNTLLASAGDYATATFDKSDAAGNTIFVNGSPTANSGNVKITSLSTASNGHANGTFDLTFGTDHATGGFDASVCAVQFPTGT